MLDLFNKKLVLKEGSINDAKAHIKKIIQHYEQKIQEYKQENKKGED